MSIVASTYTAVERLRDRRDIVIRALAPTDREALRVAVGKVGPQSLYRRFFGFKRQFSEKEVDYYVNVDFDHHVALVAVIDQEIVGAGRYIRGEPGQAEIALAVTDAWQGKGVGALLVKHLFMLARAQGLKHMHADVLAENTSMLKVFAHAGVSLKTSSRSGVVHVVMDL
jgi:GNAT superfamily N-acetyltransferase